jgi:hypothetical protein
MADFIQFTGPIKPLGSSKFSILEDKFLKGGFRVVDKKAELSSFDATVIKKGMLVAVNEEDGAIYECVDFSESADEFGDPIVVSNFQPFAANSSTGNDTDKVYVRPTKTINYTYVNSGQVVSIPIDMGCQSFVLTGLGFGHVNLQKNKAPGVTRTTGARMGRNGRDWMAGAALSGWSTSRRSRAGLSRRSALLP